MNERGGGPRAPVALEGIRVVDLSTGIAGPLASMLLADFGAEVVKVEPPAGDPGRSRAGFAMWNRNKRSVVMDPQQTADLDRLHGMLLGADVCVANGTEGAFSLLAEPERICEDNRALVYLLLPSFLNEARWTGGDECAGLLWALSGMCLRQSSFEGGPIDPAFPYVLYLQAAWAAAGVVAALMERQSSGHGQVVTVGGMHATLVGSTGSLVVDPHLPELPANAGPGGPHPLYTRYQCADGEWIFLATLTPKFQRQALDALGLSGLLEDPRIAGQLDAMLLPANRSWVRQHFVETFAARPSEEWLVDLRRADVPVGPVLRRDDWMDSPLLASIGARVQVEDPERGSVVMPGNPINLTLTPALIDRAAPRCGEHTISALGWARRSVPPGRPPVGRAPLEGIRVLDLGTILAGPYAGTLLAELGADVIKVEVPAGDSWRERGMPYIRGQRGVAIDLRSDAGREVFCDLVRTADVVVDNYRAGVLTRLRIDYDRLQKVNPEIICVSITGFGEVGPYTSEPAFDPLLQARSGMMAAQGGESEPVLLTVAVNDVTTAALAVVGTLLALFHRARTSIGQKVWLSLAGTSTFAQCEELVRMEGRLAPLTGGRDFCGPSPTERFYATRDGWVRLHLPGDDLQGLRDGGFLAGPEPTNDAELVDRLSEAFADVTREEAVRRLHDAGVPAAPARKLSEVVADPEVSAFEVFNTLERQNDTPIFVPGRYLRFSRSQHHDTLAPPGVGEHTTDVLAEIGLSPEAISELLASGAVRQGVPMAYRTQVAYR